MSVFFGFLFFLCVVAVFPPSTLHPPPPHPAGNRTLTTANFTSVTLCAPVNIHVHPGASHRVTADTGAASVPLEAVVRDGGDLVISATGPFTATRPVKIHVELPEDMLKGVSTTAAAGAVVVTGAFSTDGAFNVSAASAADLITANITASSLNVAAGGNGRTVIGGAWGSANVAAGGVADVWLVGSNANTTSVVISESAALFIAPGSDDHKIEGLALTGLPTVIFDAGLCLVPAPPFGNACASVPTIRAPRVRAGWTCGLEADGPFACPPSGQISSGAPAAAAAAQAESPAGGELEASRAGGAAAAAEAPAGGIPARRRMSRTASACPTCGAARRSARAGVGTACGPIVVTSGRSAARLVRCDAQEKELYMLPQE